MSTLALADRSPRWLPGSDLTLDAYLEKHRPSKTKDDGSTPWIWVARAPPQLEGRNAAEEEQAVKAGREILMDAEKRAQEIKTDDTIPTYAKKGFKTKKALRDELAVEVKTKLHDLAEKHRYLNGQVLMYRNPDAIDAIFALLAKSLVEGPLKSTPVDLIKVSTRNADPASKGSGRDAQHVICLYFDNVFDKAKAADIIRVLASSHGIGKGLAVKADLYTVIGLDSKNGIGMRSSIWTADELVGKDVLTALVDRHGQDELAAQGRGLGA